MRNSAGSAPQHELGQVKQHTEKQGEELAPGVDQRVLVMPREILTSTSFIYANGAHSCVDSHGCFHLQKHTERVPR